MIWQVKNRVYTINVSCVNDIPVSAIDIATETRKDTIIAQVCEYVCYDSMA